MELCKAVKDRRSIRKYKRDKVPEDELAKLLESARIAPSAANRQAYKLIVVKDQATRDKLVPACKNQGFVADAQVFIAGIEDPAQKWSEIDLTIAVDHITLAAHAAGLGTCWIGAFDPAQVASILGVPSDRKVGICLTLGVPDESPDARARKPLGELVSYEKY